MASYEGNNQEVNNVEDDQVPFFPHLRLDREELDATYPSLQSPDDFDAGNVESAEPTLQAGLKVATTIAEAMRVHGRTRRDKATNQKIAS